MSETQGTGGVAYRKVADSYFEQRGFQRYAGVWSLWALGVGAVISGHFSGWNFGFATGGWGGLLVAGIIIGIMYTGLVFCIAEMSPALPHTGAAYSFARTSMGPWGGFITGLCENVEYVVTPAVIVTFITAYVNSIFGFDAAYSPVIWVVTFIIFLALNIYGVALSYQVTLIITLLSLAVLVIFWISAIPNMDFSRWALNIAPDGSELPEGNGPWFPFGFTGVLASLPFAVWLFLAIEQLPLAAEESVDPKRDMPKGIIARHGDAGRVGLHDRAAQPVGRRRRLAQARLVARAAARRFPRRLRRCRRHGARHRRAHRPDRELPHDPLCAGPADLLAVARRILPDRAVAHASDLQDAARRDDHRLDRRARDHVHHLVRQGAETGGAIIGSVLLNMAVFGAMFSYILQAVSFILLRRNQPNIERPYVSPLGIPGAVVTIVIGVVTLLYQIQDPNFFKGVFWVLVWFAVGILYFALIGRHKLILSPEEEFALQHAEGVKPVLAK